MYCPHISNLQKLKIRHGSDISEINVPLVATQGKCLYSLKLATDSQSQMLQFSCLSSMEWKAVVSDVSCSSSVPGQLTCNYSGNEMNPKLWVALEGGRVVVFDASTWSMLEDCIQVGESQLVREQCSAVQLLPESWSELLQNCIVGNVGSRFEGKLISTVTKQCRGYVVLSYSFIFKGSKLAEMDSIYSVRINPCAKYLCRTACWDWSKMKFGSALRTPSSTSLTLRACPATNSWQNTDMKWLDSHLNPGVDTPGKEFYFLCLVCGFFGDLSVPANYNFLFQSADILLQLWWDGPAVGLSQSQSQTTAFH